MSTSNDNLYRWVKAAKDNLPKKVNDGIFRQISSKTILSLSMAKDWIGDGYFEDLEWLCKIEADQQELWDDVSDKFQSWIDNDFDERAASDVADQELKSKYTLIPKQ